MNPCIVLITAQREVVRLYNSTTAKTLWRDNLWKIYHQVIKFIKLLYILSTIQVLGEKNQLKLNAPQTVMWRYATSGHD